MKVSVLFLSCVGFVLFQNSCSTQPKNSFSKASAFKQPQALSKSDFENKKDCLKTKTAWDFGSGTIKLKSARVNLCTGKIMKVLLHKNKSLSFKEDLDGKRNKNFSDQIKAKAKKFIEEALRQIDPESSHAGVATAAFRQAKNAHAFVDELNKKYGLHLKIIDQSEEALIGLQSLKSRMKDQDADLVVWDIGGGSQQITVLKNSKVSVYKSPWASVSFKNLYLKQIALKEKVGASVKTSKSLESKIKSPNPIGSKNFIKAQKMAEALSRFFKFPGDFNKVERVYGIGGVHGASLKSRLASDEYQQQDLIQMADRFVNKDDAEIGGKYAATDVTNIALVLGTMKALKIRRVKVIKVGLVEGILTQRK